VAFLRRQGYVISTVLNNDSDDDDDNDMKSDSHSKWSSMANRRSVCYRQNVHFRTMLSVTLTYQVMTLKMSQCHANMRIWYWVIVIKSIQIRSCIPELGEKMSPIKVLAYLTIRCLAVTLIFAFLTLKSNQYIIFAKCTEVINLMKFSQAVYEVSC